jgi:glycosyltransferase involved in cell wall biosynthesis
VRFGPVAPAALPAALDVSFLGGVHPSVLPGIYAASTVAIFPARPEPLQEAKCSVRLATTLLNGVPVVASAVGEQSHFGANGAAALLPADATPAHFADAVATLLEAPAARAAMVAQAHSHLAAHYQWSQLAAQLAGFYALLLHRRGRPTP